MKTTPNMKMTSKMQRTLKMKMKMIFFLGEVSLCKVIINSRSKCRFVPFIFSCNRNVATKTNQDQWVLTQWEFSQTFYFKWSYLYVVFRGNVLYSQPPFHVQIYFHRHSLLKLALPLAMRFSLTLLRCSCLGPHRDGTGGYGR